MLPPTTRDFDTSEKLAEHKAVDSVDHVDHDAPDVAHRSRGEDRAWAMRDHLGLVLALRDVYEGVAFPKRVHGPPLTLPPA